jgi:hypothetical protein
MDSGTADQTTGDTSVPDTGVEATTPEAEAGPACVPDANLTMLTLPDASLDDAGDTVASCIGCIVTNCPTQIAACNTDCVCNSGVQKFIDCIVGTDAGAYGCGVKLATTGDALSTALGLCVAGPTFGGPGPGCLVQCGASYLLDGGKEASTSEGGGDATPDSAGEAGGDATSGD